MPNRTYTRQDSLTSVFQPDHLVVSVQNQNRAAGNQNSKCNNTKIPFCNRPPSGAYKPDVLKVVTCMWKGYLRNNVSGVSDLIQAGSTDGKSRHTSKMCTLR